MSFNTIAITGRLTRDPEAKYFESGKSVTNFSVATSGRSRDDNSSFFNCEAWNKTGQVIADYCKKGALIGIVGYIKTEKWTDKNTGQERSKQVVAVERFHFVGPKADNQRSNNYGDEPSDQDGYGEPSNEECPF